MLSPYSLCTQWAARLSEVLAGIPICVVDRKAFRELEAISPLGGSPWPEEGISVVSLDLAKQEDIASSLSTMSWDLVIVDQAHRLAAPQRASFLVRLVSTGVVKRLLLLSAVRTPAFVKWISAFSDQALPSGPISTTNWTGPLKNWDGSVVARPRVSLRVVTYTRGPDEVEFLTQFQTILPALVEAGGGNVLIAHILLRRASSSLFALEQSLQRLVQTLVSPEDLFRSITEEQATTESDPELASEEPEPLSTRPTNMPVNKAGAAGLIDQVLSSLETVTVDEKLNALIGLIRSIFDSSLEDLPHICVFSSYADTVDYVYTACKDAEFSSSKLTGLTAQFERHEVIGHFNRNGGVLISSDTALEGFSLAQVPHVIYYDLPSDPRVLEQRRGRFYCFGRSSPCTLYLFEDGSRTMVTEAKAAETVAKSLYPQDEKGSL